MALTLWDPGSGGDLTGTEVFQTATAVWWPELGKLYLYLIVVRTFRKKSCRAITINKRQAQLISN